MIQALGKSNNVNFKSLISHDSNLGPFPQKVKKLIESATDSPELEAHIDALEEFGMNIHLAPLYDSNDKPTGKFGFFKSQGDVVIREEDIDKAEKVVGKIESMQDAESLLRQTIAKSWDYAIKYVKPYINITYH